MRHILNYIITSFLIWAMPAQLWALQENPQTPRCINSPPYFVVVRDRTDSIDEDILIKYHANNSKCLYRPEPDDFTLEDVNANDFVQVVRHFLILGGGSDPQDAGFDVYDLNTRKKIYTTGYIDRDIGVTITNTTISFITVIAHGTRQNCKEYDKIVKYGDGGASLIAPVTFRLDALEHPNMIKLTETSAPTCIEME